MKSVPDLQVGFADAENYQIRENKKLFNSIFVKNDFLESLLNPSKYFLIGEKGTGKTAYAVFLQNNYFRENISQLKYISSTDYQKFITLKSEKHLQLSDYSSIWRVIILLLLSKSIKSEELDHNPISKSAKMRALMKSIDEYYANAFAPEIINVLNWVENSKLAAELVVKYMKLGGEKTSSLSFQESKFQVNLLYLQNQFEKALSDLRLKDNHILFIDGIDIRPETIPYNEYLDCIKGLADAAWRINVDFLSNIKGSKGRFRTILLLRPDIFNSIGMQNSANKIADNAVYLDWRTTYPEYRYSQIFLLADKLLSAQQDEKLELGNGWDYYFPWKSKSTNRKRDYDPSFYEFLRLSYSRPRDLVSMVKFMQEVYKEKRKRDKTFTEDLFLSSEFQNKYSEYLLRGIKDQLAFYYDENDYNNFIHFFSYLEGKAEFNYEQYILAYNRYMAELESKKGELPKFIDNSDNFLQFLYDSNIICYIEDAENEHFFYWCYRERNMSNISPRVKIGKRYQIHYGLFKALNVGFQNLK